jgi:hypothetical protein
MASEILVLAQSSISSSTLGNKGLLSERSQPVASCILESAEETKEVSNLKQRQNPATRIKPLNNISFYESSYIDLDDVLYSSIYVLIRTSSMKIRREELLSSKFDLKIKICWPQEEIRLERRTSTINMHGAYSRLKNRYYYPNYCFHVHNNGWSPMSSNVSS